MGNIQAPLRLRLILATAIILATAMLVVAQQPAHAHDHQPPETALKQGGKKLQTGRLGSHCWYPGRCLDKLSSFPSATGVWAGSKLRVRIHKSQRPQEFSIFAYRKLDEQGFPIGKPRRFEPPLRRVVESGRTVAWDALFRIERPDEHRYLETLGVWKNAQSGTHQDASWAFHVRTKRPR